MTFSSKSYLEKKTGTHGVGRLKYLQTLVTEFQDTHRQEFKKQILANLGNFAYDPINYEHFRALNILDLFLDVLAEELDGDMIRFAMGGVCNCCLDKANKNFLIENDGIGIVARHLNCSDLETVQSAITTLMFLTTPQSKKEITSEGIVKAVQAYTDHPDKHLSNLAVIFLEDYCNISHRKA